MSVSSKKLTDTENYCNLRVKRGIIINIKDKEKSNRFYRQFTGLAYIKDYSEFWEGISEAHKKNKTEISNGFRKIIGKKIYT